MDWSQLESALSLSRKAFRLGKFLNNVKKFRALLAAQSSPPSNSKTEEEKEKSQNAATSQRERAFLVLSLVFNFSEGVYYFLDQFQFLVKAKMVNKKGKTAKEVKRWATYFELLSYVADSVCQCLHIQKEEHNRRSRSIAEAKEDRKMKAKAEAEAKAEREIFESKVVLLQNGADFLMALNDLREVDQGLGNPSFLALLGVLSAVIGIRSKWQ